MKVVIIIRWLGCSVFYRSILGHILVYDIYCSKRAERSV